MFDRLSCGSYACCSAPPVSCDWQGCAGSSDFYGEALAAGVFPQASAFTSASLFSRHFFDHSRLPSPSPVPGPAAASTGGAPSSTQYLALSPQPNPMPTSAIPMNAIPTLPLPGHIPPESKHAKEAEAEGDAFDAFDDGSTVISAGGGGEAATTSGSGGGGSDALRARFSCAVVNAGKSETRISPEYFVGISLHSQLDGRSGFRAPLRYARFRVVVGRSDQR